MEHCPPRTHTGVEGLHNSILGYFHPAIVRVVLKCYGWAVIACIGSQSGCFSVLPYMPANTGAGSWLKDNRATIGGSLWCVASREGAASLFSATFQNLGSSVNVSPPPSVEGQVQKGAQRGGQWCLGCSLLPRSILYRCILRCRLCRCSYLVCNKPPPGCLLY